MWSRGRKLFWNKAHALLIGGCLCLQIERCLHLVLPHLPAWVLVSGPQGIRTPQDCGQESSIGCGESRAGSPGSHSLVS